MTTKCCSKCGETKPLGDFHAAKDCAHGRRPECKKCANAYSVKRQRERYVPKRGRIDMSPAAREARRLKREQRGALRRRLDAEARAGVKTCKRCGESKALDGFQQRGNEPPRFDATCRKCRAAQARAKWATKRAAAEREV